MNEKEIAELRRRFRPDKTNITKVRGCYVNESKEIVSTFEQPLCLMAEDESEGILKILKKTLSGQVGKNLIDIEFTNGQVLEGEEHKLLSRLRESALEDKEAVSDFFTRAVESIQFDGSYLLMLISDSYDVFSYGKDGSKNEDSVSVFSYILSCVCPVKLTTPQISYYTGENAFHNIAVHSVVASPEFGFLFPAFDDRTANIYNALFYTRNLSDDHESFIDRIFGSRAPMPADVQKEVFQTVLATSVPEAGTMEFVRSFHEQVSDLMDAEQEQDEEDEALMLSAEKIGGLIRDCGGEETSAERFEKEYKAQFGEAKLLPKNLIDRKHFEVKTPDVVIKVNPDRLDLVRTEVINGAKYILIRADDNVEVNGMDIKITQ
ncbi:MAG: DUF4317 family protein [Ruminococcaceae bacterium]|nr:DUF4317 family protein [Oscillospiraceae bacterium]